MMSEDRLREKSLGRNVQLGSFYNARLYTTSKGVYCTQLIARTGMFFPESSLWSRKTITNATESKNNNALTSLDYTTDFLTKEKMNHMGISADLTLKFMGRYKISSESEDYIHY